jgi:hypothetical protein
VSLYDLIIFEPSAPRHSWKWLMSTLRDQGFENETVDDWLRQVRVGIPYHRLGAELLAIRQLREEFCSCPTLGKVHYGDPLTCRTCKLLDRLVEFAPQPTVNSDCDHEFAITPHDGKQCINCDMDEVTYLRSQLDAMSIELAQLRSEKS